MHLQRLFDDKITTLIMNQKNSKSFTKTKKQNR